MSRLDFEKEVLRGPARKLMCEWFKKHGEDPLLIPLYTWVERDEEACQIRYLGYVFNLLGRQGTIVVIDYAKCEVLCREKVVQLEARPLPFPDLSEWGYHEES